MAGSEMSGRERTKRPHRGAGDHRFLGWAHSSLVADDLDPAISFFEQAFGFEVTFRENGMTRQIASITGIEGLSCDLVQLRHHATAHLLELVAFRVPGEASMSASAPVRPGGGHLAFLVGNLDDCLTHIEPLGGRMIGEITSFEDCLAAYVRVPGGVYLELEQLLKPQ